MQNKFGVAVKDASEVYIDGVEFFKNEEQVSAYKKNLQYGSGGKAIITNSFFSNYINLFTSNNSSIDIKNSFIDGEVMKKGKTISIN